MKCTGDYSTHHTGCECHEAKWQRVARALHDEYVAMVSRAGYHNVEETVANWMRLVGLEKRCDKWEFIE